MTLGKKISLLATALLWTAATFYAGMQFPTLLDDLFVEQEEVVIAKFYPLDKFIISISGDDYPRYLLLELAIKSTSDNASATLKEADPLIRNTLMLMFSRKQSDQLNGAGEINSLQHEAQSLLSNVLSANKFEINIEEVLFTRMVIQ